MKNITFISAGAGSGKTYRLAEDLEQILKERKASPAGVIGTTFTKLAASELRERVRQRLNTSGLIEIANQMDQARLGTVNSVCGSLLERFAFEAGLSPRQAVIEDEAAALLFSRALEEVVSIDEVEEMHALSFRLGRENWKDEVATVAKTARANNHHSDQLSDFAEQSIETIKGFMQQSKERDLTGELLDTLSKSIASIDDNIQSGVDTTKGTVKYLTDIRRIKHKLKANRLPWSEWIKLSKSKPTKKSEQFVEATQMVAADVERHADLHMDIERYTRQIFSLASRAMDGYQSLKKSKHLLDFTDQEQLLYQVLGHPVVRDTLSEELDLLMVDEFQDTSPIQLALFLRLSSLATRVIWVGDIKQAIYGFRGSDPELMQAILGHLEANGGNIDILGKSWRSRPELVEYANAIFVPAFANSMEENRVSLEPEHETRDESIAVSYWHLSGSNAAKRGHNLAEGIKELIKSKYPVKDQFTGESRPIQYGDIAVLGRANDTLDDLLAPFHQWQLPCQRERTGLMKTPEASLLIAAIKLMIDPRDTLAIAEIVTLCRSSTPEDWLNDRLTKLYQPNDDDVPWGHDVPQVKAILEQQERTRLMTPSEIVNLAITATQLHRTVLQWSPDKTRARQRLLNIKQMQEFADKYESWCQSEHQPPTTSGLLIWLGDLADRGLDTQPTDPEHSAIQLLTYYKAKGLEWPVVIALDMHKSNRSRIWGMTVSAPQEDFDATRPLAGRQLRYLTWPFGKQATGIALNEAVVNSQLGQEAAWQAEEEAKRLLYVGMTRPSNLLVLPMQNRTGAWLSSVTVGSDDPWMLPDGDTLTLPDSIIPTSSRSYTVEEAPGVEPRAPESQSWLTPVTSRHDKLPAKISPSEQIKEPGATVGRTLVLGERLALNNNPDMAQLGSALHALIATRIINSGGDGANLASQVMQHFGMDGVIDDENALQSAERFIATCQQEFHAVRILAEYPVDYLLPNGQRVTGWIDALVETADGYIIIDHKSSPRSRAESEQESLKYSGQLALYKQAVELLTGKVVLGCWVHFAVMGVMVEVGLSVKSAA